MRELKPAVTGILVASAIILAFVAGSQIELRDDGPVEEFTEAVDEMSKQAQ
ncbi:hypothetical protein H0I76_13130 [Limibaculum sp. M0105]|uniref:Uncharacterized protein n=1 Tax=Thermohalobaculum xanthum TaxID=2753746 RepID=A0A8J7M8F7_9RHOB|nr:hypothetical protein [Thermohalobaculum xanthum]MBK0400135.1 hypothetical protein [Thermohalobaculum xanthum]